MTFQETKAAKARDQKYKEEHGLAVKDWGCSWPIAAVITLIVTLAFLRLLLTDKEDPNEKMFTPHNLALYDGKGPNPIYISILGQVFDVTSGRKFYGGDEGYACFVGRDSTRAFITGEFKKDLTDDLSGFSDADMMGLVSWRNFYHEKYIYKGRLIGRFYHASGEKTKALVAVEEAAERGKAAEEARAKIRTVYPSCNTRWTQEEGGVVWCPDGMYPRKIQEDDSDLRDPNEVGGPPIKWRCACFKELGWSDLRQVYDDCDPDAHECRTAPATVAPASAA